MKKVALILLIPLLFSCAANENRSSDLSPARLTGEILQIFTPGPGAGEFNVILIRPDLNGSFSYKSEKYVTHDKIPSQLPKIYNIGFFISGKLQKSEQDNYDIEIKINKIDVDSWGLNGDEYFPSFNNSSMKTAFSLNLNEEKIITPLLNITSQSNGKMDASPFSGIKLKVLPNDSSVPRYLEK